MASSSVQPLRADIRDVASPREDRAIGPDRQLEAAFRTQQDPLLRYVRGHAGSDAAPDIVQEVFARAAGSRQLGMLENPAGFLWRVARNLLIDHARRAARRPVHVPLDEARDAGSPASQHLDLEAKQLLALYEAAVASLPTKTRRVFVMHRVDEMTYRDIHVTLGISIGTVEYHMARALTHIAMKVGKAR